MYRFSFLVLGLIIGGVLMSNLQGVSAQFVDNFIDSYDLATDPTNGECLTTDGTNNVWSSSCGGGGSSKWESVGGFLQPIAAYVNDAIKGSSFVATSTATSTFAGPINLGTNHIVTHGVWSDASDGLHIHAGNGTNVGLFGAGNTANSLFYGGVNIDGATRLATSLSGLLKATSGAVSAATAGTDYLSTTTPWTVGNLAFVASNGGLLSSVATGTLTTTATGTQLSATRALIGGPAIFSWSTGYDAVLVASTTQWKGFYDTPSTRITAGTGLSWSTNTLNCATAAAGTQGCLTAADWITFNGKVSSTSIDTSAEIATLVTDETGTAGNLVFSGSPTLTGLTTLANYTATNGTTTNSTSTSLAVSTSFNFLGTIITNVTTWFSTTLNAVSSFVAAAASTWDFGGATSVEIVNGTAPTVDAAGEIAIDTTSGQLIWHDGVKKQVITGTSSPSFNISSSTQDGNGFQFSSATSTFLLKNFPEAISLSSWYCKATSTGSVLIRFGDGTNWTNAGTCSTTGAAVTATANNTFTANEDFMVQIGSSATSPSRVTITTRIVKTAD